MPSPLPSWLERRLESAPRSPGCYLMKDRQDVVVYVGKARDLRARIKQYFVPSPSDTRFFVGLLESTLSDIEIIVTSNNKEALVLENTLIKRHQPRFNVKLKDDKTFLSLRLGKKHPWPRLEVVRRRKSDGAAYFGPYHSASAIRKALRVVNRHFQLRTCTDVEFRNRSRPCLEHQIGRCPAPCVLPVSADSYRESLHEVSLFLRGRGDGLVSRLRERMAEASGDLKFEVAARIRDQIQAIECSLERQVVQLDRKEDIDVIGLYREGTDAVAQVMEIRGGALAGTRSHPLREVYIPDRALINDVLFFLYGEDKPIPDRVLLPLELEDAETWGELLTERRSKRVRVHHPRRGDKRRLLELAQTNAQETYRVRHDEGQRNMATLEQLRDRLGLRQLPSRIECYDISNTQGTDPTGSMVVAIDGEASKRDYRSFAVRQLDTPDDFKMMEEVLTRRFERGEALGELPDLVVIDGGKGQLGVASAVLEGLEVGGVELCSLAKSRLLDDQGMVLTSSLQEATGAPKRSPERCFVPGRKNPVNLKESDPAMKLLQRLRDEAHRFAITHHKRRRSRGTIQSALDQIPGVGPARRTTLLKHFGSVKAIREASLNDLHQVPGLPKGTADQIHRWLRDPQGP